MARFLQLELRTHHINVMLWGLFSIGNTKDKRIKNNHPNGILIKMMQNPFSQQDTVEKASPNISFLMSNNWDESVEEMQSIGVVKHPWLTLTTLPFLLGFQSSSYLSSFSLTLLLHSVSMLTTQPFFYLRGLNLPGLSKVCSSRSNCKFLALYVKRCPIIL